MSSQLNGLSVNGVQKTPGVKARKIRKGTFSCWECKRRKKRCQFQHSSSTTCMTCHQNGVLCISQESEERAGYGSAQNEKRLADMEMLVDQLIQQRMVCQRKGSTGELPEGVVEATRRKLSKSNPLTLLRITEDPQSRFGSLCNYLQSVLPCSTTVMLIASHGSSPLAVLERRTDIVEGLTTAAQQLSPITVALKLARKLVQLALCLERVNNNKSKLAYLDFKLGASNDTIARRFVDAACQVTCHDSILNSLDGIELLMLQSSFQTCVGNLQSAWLTLRRALNIAQLMNLLQITGQAWRRRRETWLRLVHFDRVLSLMLGQRASADGNNFTNGLEVTDDSSSTKLESAHTVILDRIISRNLRMQDRVQRDVETNDPFDDGLETQIIDEELKKAMRSLPATWWAQPEMPKSEPDAAMLLGQIHHFDLLVLVHQPYLIQGPHIQYPNSSNGSHGYNKLTAVSASREILSRVLLCGDNRDVPCSLSGLNHKAFTACVTLLFAHISGHPLGCANVLEHQRPLDLTTIQKVIDLFGDLLPKTGRRSTWDASVLRQLLHIEEGAAKGKACLIRAGNAPFRVESNGRQQEVVELQFSIPYLGQITVTSQHTDDESLRLVLDTISSDDHALVVQQSIYDASANSECWPNCPVDQLDTSWDLDSLIEPGDFLMQAS